MKRVSWPGVILVAGSTIYSWVNTAPGVPAGVPSHEPAARIASRVPAAQGEASAAAIDALQLHDWSSKAQAHGRHDRDIFSFTRPAPKPAPLAALPPAAGLLAPGGAGQPAPIALFKLIGVAEDASPDGRGETSRTAIISGQGQLYLVKEGETVAWIYRVGRLSADGVELLDTTGGPALRLFLK
jgi:hypothetical protein